MWWLCSLAVIAVDQLTKWWTHSHLPLMSHASPYYPYGGIPIWKNFLGTEFSLSYAANRGMAWGTLAQFQWWLVGGRLALIAALLLFACSAKCPRNWKVPIALILGGAISNVLDAFTYGYVVDMLHFVLWGYDFPVFNVADAAICIGVAWAALAGALCPQKGDSS